MAAEQWSRLPALRYSIRQLILGMALVALACVALRSAGPVWAAALLGGVLVLLGAAIPLALFREGQKRAFWFGFALFGWLYLLVLAYGWSLDPNASPSNPLRPQALITSQLSACGYDRLYPVANQVTTYGLPKVSTMTVSDGGRVLLRSADSRWPVVLDGTSNTVTASEVYFSITGSTAPAGPAREHFVNVAHAFWALLISLGGGWFSCWVFATRTPRPASSENPAAIA